MHGTGKLDLGQVEGNGLKNNLFGLAKNLALTLIIFGKGPKVEPKKDSITIPILLKKPKGNMSKLDQEHNKKKNANGVLAF